MTRYGYFNALIKCFYSRDFYRDVVQNWQGGVVLHLIIVLLLTCLAFAVEVQKNVSLIYTDVSQTVLPQIPDMRIENGKLVTPENKPYVIQDSHHKVVAIIDTSGKYTSLSDTTAELLVTTNTMFYKSHNHVKAHVFNANLKLDLSRDHIHEVLSKVIDWLWLIMLPFLLIFAFMFRLLQIAIYSIIGKIFALLCATTLTYGEVFKITVFAITPVIFLNAVFNWLSISFHWETLLSFLITMGYVVFGIYANKSIAKG